MLLNGNDCVAEKYIAVSDLVLHYLSMSHKKDVRLIWVNHINCLLNFIKYANTKPSDNCVLVYFQVRIYLLVALLVRCMAVFCVLHQSYTAIFSQISNIILKM